MHRAYKVVCFIKKSFTALYRAKLRINKRFAKNIIAHKLCFGRLIFSLPRLDAQVSSGGVVVRVLPYFVRWQRFLPLRFKWVCCKRLSSNSACAWSFTVRRCTSSGESIARAESRWRFCASLLSLPNSPLRLLVGGSPSPGFFLAGRLHSPNLFQRLSTFIAARHPPSPFRATNAPYSYLYSWSAR